MLLLAERLFTVLLNAALISAKKMLHLDEDWMLAPPTLIRCVAKGVKIAREYLLAKARQAAHAFMYTNVEPAPTVRVRTIPPPSTPTPVILGRGEAANPGPRKRRSRRSGSRIALRASGMTALRKRGAKMFRILPRWDDAKRPEITSTYSRGISLGKLRAKLALFEKLMSETQEQHDCRIARLGRALAQRLSRRPRIKRPKPRYPALPQLVWKPYGNGAMYADLPLPPRVRRIE